jgi:hypothetical protein
MVPLAARAARHREVPATTHLHSTWQIWHENQCPWHGSGWVHWVHGDACHHCVRSRRCCCSRPQVEHGGLHPATSTSASQGLAAQVAAGGQQHCRWRAVWRAQAGSGATP